MSPEIRPLDRSDIDAILARNTVGRIAYLRGGRVDVVPINYVFREGSLYGRTEAHGKLDFLQDSGVGVAFQVDEIHSANNWKSVLVHGSFQIVKKDLGEEGWMRALGAVRRSQKGALRSDDPFPERIEIFRILIDQATGRSRG